MCSPFGRGAVGGGGGGGPGLTPEETQANLAWASSVQPPMTSCP